MEKQVPKYGASERLSLLYVPAVGSGVKVPAVGFRPDNQGTASAWLNY
jgi:hypothetical protein